MANEEHLMILKQGVEVWNRWRENKPEPSGPETFKLLFPDLRGANLCETNLSGANLQYVNLTGSDLSGTNLRQANLNNANLSKADLIGANLTGAVLSKIKLAEAKIDGTTLLDNKWRPSSLSERPILLAKTPNLPLLLDQILDELTHFTLKMGINQATVFLSDRLLAWEIVNQFELNQNFFEANLQKVDLSETCLDRANLMNRVVP
jgi:uncharacterized protein YjbI with pentapeptide repeats